MKAENRNEGNYFLLYILHMFDIIIFSILHFIFYILYFIFYILYFTASINIVVIKVLIDKYYIYRNDK